MSSRSIWKHDKVKLVRIISYLNSYEDAKKAHQHILSQNSCDVSVLIVIDVEQGVAEHDRGLCLGVCQVVSGVTEAKEFGNLTEDTLRLSEAQIYRHIVVLHGCQVADEQICRLSCLHHSLDVVLLELERLMLESEPCGLDSPLVIENDIKRVLLSTNTIFLAALAVDLDLREHSHLLIKR